METTLKATIRDEKGSPESRRLRTEGLLPAVVYGEGMESTSVYINAREFTNALKTDAGSNIILNIGFRRKECWCIGEKLVKFDSGNIFGI